MVFIVSDVQFWLALLIMPFLNFDLLWRMLPVYLNGLLASIYFPPSDTASVFGGLTALWAGADWIRTYVTGGVYPSQTNWIIAIIFCVYGVAGLMVGLRKKQKFYSFFGRRSILTFFAISFYPIQTNYITSFTSEFVTATVIMAIPVIVLLEVFAKKMRRNVLKLS